MKIVCIATSRVPSNTANSIQVMKACHALKLLGHDVTLLLPGEVSTPWEALTGPYGLETPFEIEWLPSDPRLKRYDFAWSAMKKAQSLGADAVYTWLAQAALLAVQRRIPAVFELHDRPTGRIGPWLFRRLMKARGKKRLVCITHALQSAVEHENGLRFDPHEVVVAPNGVDLEHYAQLPDAAEARRQLDLPEGLTVGYTGHFYAGRGMDVLMALAQQNPTVNFLWVGGRAADVAAWREQTAQAGLHNVTLTGFVEQTRLPLYQAAADILLMPYERAIAGSSGGNSADICSPMKMFDYMAAGRAIITSDLPVIREVLNERNALFCPPEDTAAWQSGLTALLADSARRTALAVEAKAAVSRYTWRARAEKILEGF